ncbi:hypothetical protein G6703_04975 [Polynucleobacter paneuropaeus]|jgi:predicted site-specific integrase-resolvase|nr:hypothetical protein G6703_04975 [Polynucleobacter paneuropaeus]
MKRYIALISLSMFNFMIAHAAEAPFNFKNSDLQAFWQAVSQKNTAECGRISNADQKNFCLAQVSNSEAYCSSIGSALIQKQCRSMTSGSDTVASHKK